MGRAKQKEGQESPPRSKKVVLVSYPSERKRILIVDTAIMPGKVKTQLQVIPGGNKV